MGKFAFQFYTNLDLMNKVESLPMKGGIQLRMLGRSHYNHFKIHYIERNCIFIWYLVAYINFIFYP